MTLIQRKIFKRQRRKLRDKTYLELRKCSKMPIYMVDDFTKEGYAYE